VLRCFRVSPCKYVTILEVGACQSITLPPWLVVAVFNFLNLYQFDSYLLRSSVNCPFKRSVVLLYISVTYPRFDRLSEAPDALITLPPPLLTGPVGTLFPPRANKLTTDYASPNHRATNAAFSVPPAFPASRVCLITRIIAQSLVLSPTSL
jgi:hypothetical protein